MTKVKAQPETCAGSVAGFARIWKQLLVVFAAVFVLLVYSAPANAQKKTATNWRVERILLHKKFGSELQELAMWCRKNGTDKKQITETFKVYRQFNLDRQYIFLPTEKSMPVVNGDSLGARWLGKLNEVRNQHAARLFDLAKEASDKDSYSVAFQLLHEVIHYDRDHAEARRILGHKKLNDGSWKIHSEKVKPARPASRRHDIISGWPAKSYKTVNTRHFRIDSNATDAETELLAQWLESWHYAWRQVFFEYWAKAPIIKKWFSGSGSLKIPKRRFRVIFFKDHADYVKQLMPIQPGIENTVGYYNGNQKVSFFPATDLQGQRDDKTWRHELAHQLFRESITTRPQPFAAHSLWLDEGLAMHFESLTIDGQIATLGGFDSQRLQFSRWRRLRENFHVPIGELAVMDMPSFQKRRDLPLVYAESAGVAHMLMDSREYDMQPVLVRFMKQIHQRKVKPGTFQKMIGRTYEELDADYLRFLKVKSTDVEKRIEKINTISELAAMDGQLRESAFDVIGTCGNLRKLDISRATFTRERARKLFRLDLLSELYLSACVVEPGSLKPLRELDSLKEIDLSHSSINDAQLVELLEIPELQLLQIANTRVTDAGLATIAKIPKLTVFDVTGSKVTAAGVANFKRARPNVNVLQRK